MVCHPGALAAEIERGALFRRRIAAMLLLSACARNVDWPVDQGSDANDH